MTVESVTLITDLNPLQPPATDIMAEGAEHIRNLKTGILGTFSAFTGAAITATEADLNRCDITTEGTSEASKVVTANSSGVVTIAGSITYPDKQKTIIKASDETISSTTTYQADNAIISGIEAEINTDYGFEMYLRVESPAAADFKFYIAIPAAATIAFKADTVSAETAYTQGSEADTVISTTGTGTVDAIRVCGTISVGGTAGGLATLFWAQNSSDAGNTTVKAKSWIKIFRET